MKCNELNKNNKELTDKNRPNIFTFNGKYVTKIAHDNTIYNFMFFEEIPFDKEFRFNVKIIKSSFKAIWIGVVDYEEEK